MKEWVPIKKAVLHFYLEIEEDQDIHPSHETQIMSFECVEGTIECHVEFPV